MFHMSNDSHLFHNEPSAGIAAALRGKADAPVRSPFRDLRRGRRDSRCCSREKANATFQVRPRYWVDAREAYLRTAVLPPGLLEAIRNRNSELIVLAMAHLRFSVIGSLGGSWPQTNFSQPGVPSSNTFNPRATLHQPVLGLCGNNPASLAPLDASYLPADPVSSIKRSEREVTAWYAADKRAVSQYLSFIAKFPVDVEKAAHLNSVEEVLALAEELLEKAAPKWLMAFRAIGRPTDTRTMIFSLLPRCAVGNSAPVFPSLAQEPSFHLCLLGNLNAAIFDFVARTKVGGANLNFFIVEQLPVLPPSFYRPADITYVGSRVFELVYTANDMQPFADALCVSESPLATSVPRMPYRWDEERRVLLRAELDAWFARAYGLTRKELRYILDPADLTARELENILDPWEEVRDPLNSADYAQRVATSDFPSETFRVLKEKERAKFGEYRTRRLVLEAWETLQSISNEKCEQD